MTETEAPAAPYLSSPTATPASDAGYSTLTELFERSAIAFALRPLFGVKKDGAWRWSTYGDMLALVGRVRSALADLGVGPGDKVAVISDNRPEWVACAHATFGLRAAIVAMYESQRADDWEFILRDCGAKVLFVSKPEHLAKVRAFLERTPSVRHVICFDVPEGHPASFAAFAATDRRFVGERPRPDDVACLIYTSGTTGKPKGVVLTHRNVATNVAAVEKLFPIGTGDRSLSFLPWAHVFGFTAELHCMMSIGASLAICEGVDKIVPNLAEVKPSILFAVPRIFNKIYTGVRQQMAAKPKPVRGLFERGLAASSKRRSGAFLGWLEYLLLWLADAIVFAKIRKKFGGKLRYAVSGGAALSPDVAEFVDSLGITVYEGYGLSETSPIVTCNHPGARRIGTVGKPIDGVRVVIDRSVTGHERDGEIVVYGPNVMRGYHERPEETAAVMTADGGLRTGDMGRFDEDGMLRITGRIKEQYKLENGKYVVPSPLEEALKLSPYVANVFITGDNRPFNVALVVPNLQGLAPWTKERGIELSSMEAAAAHPAVKDLLRAEIDRLSKDWKGYDKVRRIAVIPEDFTQENGLLTPKMSLKRAKVAERWKDAIDALYRNA